MFDVPNGGSIAGQGAVIHTNGFNADFLAVEAHGGLLVNMPAALNPRFRAFLTPEDFDRRNNQVKDRVKRLDDYFEAAQRYLDAKRAHQGWATDVKLEALEPYFAGEKPVFVSAESAATIRSAIAFVKKFKFKGVIVGASDAWKLIKPIKDSGIPLIISPPQIQCPGEDAPSDSLDPYDAPMALPAILHRSGIKFAFASNSFDEAFSLPNRIGRACAFGLPWDAAMRACTLDAAEILGVSDRLGSLDGGKIANVVVSDGDPLELASQVRYLFVRGKPVPVESRYTELWSKYAHR
jgi:imidazolonepropionase-like amidohydrolase